MTLDSRPFRDPYREVLELSQSGHIARCNELGIVMASMADFYEAGKSADQELIESLRTDFNESWTISSTKIQYDRNSLEGTITHYFDSTVVEPIEQKLIIPVYYEVGLDAVLNNEQGLAYLQALFNTSDDSEEIKATLQELNGRTQVWTPGQDSRRNNPDQAAGLYYYYDRSILDGGCFNFGSSRGVLESPARVAVKYPNSPAKRSSKPKKRRKKSQIQVPNRWNTLEIDGTPCPPYQPKIEKSVRFEMLEIDG